jgi:hypothetical protein
MAQKRTFREVESSLSVVKRTPDSTAGMAAAKDIIASIAACTDQSRLYFVSSSSCLLNCSVADDTCESSYLSLLKIFEIEL